MSRHCSRLALIPIRCPSAYTVTSAYPKRAVHESWIIID
jgi:hypothetical protein